MVTNADEVEPEYRIHLSRADLAPGGEYAPTYPEVSGKVEVRSTGPPPSEMSYIPRANPAVTRLSTMATEIIREVGCDVVFAYYLEPYGVAAHLAGRWTGIPYVVKHAGSDLYRLLPLEELRTAYREVMIAANRVVSGPMGRDEVLMQGIPEARIVSDGSFGLPEEHFHPSAPPLNLPALFAESRESTGGEGPWLPNELPMDDSFPVLGIYGKVGTYKGSFDLLLAVAELIKGGVRLYLVAATHGPQEGRFRRMAEELGIAHAVRILPFLPTWTIPRLIRSCTAVVFLERNFPIAAHGSTVPSEVVACGTCLVVSGEIARKQRFRSSMQHMHNVVIVPDPRHYYVLAAALRRVLEDPQRAEQIGRRGYEELSRGSSYEAYIARLESLLMEVADEKPV